MPLDKGSLMPPQHRWHAAMGEGRLNRNPVLWVQEELVSLEYRPKPKPDMMQKSADIGGEEGRELLDLKKR